MMTETNQSEYDASRIVRQANAEKCSEEVQEEIVEEAVEMMTGDSKEKMRNPTTEEIAYEQGQNPLGYRKTFEMVIGDSFGSEPKIKLFETDEFDDARAILYYTEVETSYIWAVQDREDIEKEIKVCMDANEDALFAVPEIDFEYEINVNSFGFEA